MQQNWQHAYFRIPIAFHCMFVTTNFHSQKLKFPVSKCVPLAKYFSGGGVLSDKINSKNPEQLSCDLPVGFNCSGISVRWLHIVAYGKDKLPLIISNKLSSCTKQLLLSRCTINISVREIRFAWSSPKTSKRFKGRNRNKKLPSYKWKVKEN